MGRIKYRLKRLPLFLKLLIPFLTLILIVGSFGAFLIVRDLASRAQSSLDQNLTQSSVNTHAVLHDRELYLLESATFAGNLRGMAQAISARDAERAASLLESVAALKADLTLVSVTDADGNTLVEFLRESPNGPIEKSGGGAWATYPFVRQALGDPGARKFPGFIELEGKSLFVIAGAICVEASPCRASGTAIVGISLDQVLRDASSTVRSADSVAGVAIYDPGGNLLSSVGKTPTRARVVRFDSGSSVRRNEAVGGRELSSLYSPFEIQGRREGVVAVTLEREEAFTSVGDSAVKLVLILLAAIAGIVAIGGLLSKLIVAQVRPLLETNRALGAGDLTARAPVVTEDELGELARGVNQMAEQLEASYSTLESRVSERTAEVQRLLSERTEFFAGVSHEFRTPLAVIISQAELMLDPTYPRRGRWSSEIGEIRDSAQQLLFLINDILDLARADAGRIAVNLDDVSVPKVIEGLTNTAAGLASAGSLELIVEVPSKMPIVRADGYRLREVILNLIDNATKYTPPGGTVRVRVEMANGSVQISVADDGVGIPPDAQERIFDPFYRVPGIEPQRGQSSSGLGLALAKRFVEAQGGQLVLSSVPGEGSTFSVTLPVAKGRPRRRHLSVTPAPVATSEPSRKTA